MKPLVGLTLAGVVSFLMWVVLGLAVLAVLLPADHHSPLTRKINGTESRAKEKNVE
jgi:hypothetical protein